MRFLNYLCAILQAEARIAALRMGLDPGLGFLHTDQKARDSLPCDLMEPVRPKVDAHLMDLLASRVFQKRDFFETCAGICRLMPPLTHQLADTGSLWAKELGPVTESVARTLFETVRNPKTTTIRLKAMSPRKHALPTPLTESNRGDGREPYRRRPEPKTAEELRVSNGAFARKPIGSSRRKERYLKSTLENLHGILERPEVYF